MSSDPNLEAADAVLHPAVAAPRQRPTLIHSNNLHSGSFLDYNSDDDPIAEETRFKEHHHYTDNNHYTEKLLKLVSDNNEWGKLHDALRQKRRKFCTNASIQQCLNQLLEEQTAQMDFTTADSEQGHSNSDESRTSTSGNEIRTFSSILDPRNRLPPRIVPPFHKV
jgi:hypothetical protein